MEFIRLAVVDYPEQYLESQDFAHLVVKAVEAAAKERDVEKRRMYARILVRGTLPPWNARPGSVEEAIRSLAELTVADFQVLRAVIDHWQAHADGGERTNGMMKFKPADLQGLLPGFDPRRLQPYLARLQRRGLVIDVSTGTWDDMGGTFTTTPLLFELAGLIEQ